MGRTQRHNPEASRCERQDHTVDRHGHRFNRCFNLQMATAKVAQPLVIGGAAV
jgi:hypothetical protein